MQSHRLLPSQLCPYGSPQPTTGDPSLHSFCSFFALPASELPPLSCRLLSTQDAPRPAFIWRRQITPITTTNPSAMEMPPLYPTSSENPSGSPHTSVRSDADRGMCLSKPGLSYAGVGHFPEAKPQTVHSSLFNFMMLALAQRPFLYKSLELEYVM